jgi:hypothetical protein
MDLKETGCEEMDSILISEDRDIWRIILNTEIHLRIPYKVEN